MPKKRQYHGKSGTRTYYSWHAMLQRATDPKSKDYHRYGAVGIGLDEAWWVEFSEFLKDMGEAPEGLTLDRIDNTKGYSATNCRWATPSQQQDNRSNSRKVEYQGREQTLREWFTELNLDPPLFKRVWARVYNQGMSLEKAITPGKMKTGTKPK